MLELEMADFTAKNVGHEEANQQEADAPEYVYNEYGGRIDISITDDVDDEAIYGRNRRRNHGYSR